MYDPRLDLIQGETDVWGILMPGCGIGAPTWASVFLLAKNMGVAEKNTGRTYICVSHCRRQELFQVWLFRCCLRTIELCCFFQIPHFPPASTNFNESLNIYAGVFRPKPSWLQLTRDGHCSLTDSLSGGKLY